MRYLIRIFRSRSSFLLVVSFPVLLLACSPPAVPELRGIDGWINSRPLTLEELRGKVVLIDFWTYSCVNCIRTFPHLKEWHDRYSDYGLVVIGVHTPEFEFETVRDNVEAAAQLHGLNYPIAQDNSYATWNAFGNNAWPAKYLIDHEGNLRYQHLGEGAYAETEQKIRELLTETGLDLGHIESSAAPDPEYAQEAYSADPASRITRELYAGYERNDVLPSSAFATLVGPTPAYIMHEKYYQQKNADILYQDPGDHFNHFIYLQGLWHNGPQSISHARSTPGFDDYIAIKFYATSVNAVMSSCAADSCDLTRNGPVRVMVTLDGRPLTRDEAGADVQFDSEGRGFVTVDEPRMYELVQLGQFSSHELKLSSREPGFSLFTFTFGAYNQGP